MEEEKEQETGMKEQIQDQEETQVEETEGEVASEKQEEEEKSDEVSLEDQLNEARDKYLRLYSEFENFRRRTSKEKLDLISTANKDLMADLIPVVDDFERAMSVANNGDETSLKEGIGLIQDKLVKLLETKGLKGMKVKKGDKFDDERHEAITQIPAEKKLAGKVVEVVESGYYLGKKVVRFAKVVVGAKQ